MSPRPQLSDRINPELRQRFERLSPESQARVLIGLEESRRRRSQSRLALVQIRPASPGADASRAPLVILPSMFGDVGEWRDFFEDTTTDRSVHGIELDGDKPYWTNEVTLEEIASEAAALLRRQLPNRRLHLAGYSFGGRLAFELGRQMAAEGSSPLSIVIIDCVATRRDKRNWRDVTSIAGNAVPWLVHELSTYGPKDLGRRVWSRWRFRNGSGEDEHLDRLNQVFDLARLPKIYQQRLWQSRRASVAYHPKPAPNRVLYLRSRFQSLIHDHRPDGGWGALVPPDRLTVRMLPSDHGSALHPRWRGGLLREMEAAFGAAEAAAS